MPATLPVSATGNTAHARLVRSPARSSMPALEMVVGGCAVCRERDDENLLHCRKCGVDVHPDCAGYTNHSHSPNSNHWLCLRCQAGVDPQSSPCFVCGSPSGFLAPTSDRRWVDIVCGIWVPGVRWKGSARSSMEELVDIHSIDPALFGRECSVCHSNYGCCYRCSANGCSVYFHPTCGQSAGFSMSLDDRGLTGSADISDWRLPTAMCRSHSTQKLECKEEQREPENSCSTSPSAQSALTATASDIHANHSNRSNHTHYPNHLSHSLSRNLSSPSPMPAFSALLASYRSRMEAIASPTGSPSHSPAPSPPTSNVHSPTNVTELLPVNDPSLVTAEQYIDKRTFHNLIESYMRPVTAIDLLRLGQLQAPPSERSVRRAKEKRERRARGELTVDTAVAPQSPDMTLQQKLLSPQSSPLPVDQRVAKQEVVECTHSHGHNLHHTHQHNHNHSLDYRHHQQRVPSHRPPSLPFVPFERDPSLLVPHLGLVNDTWSTEPDGRIDAPYLPSIDDLPHIAALMGTDIPVFNERTMKTEMVCSSAACIVRPQQGLILIEESNDVDDAWHFQPAKYRPQRRGLDFLHVAPESVLDRSSSPYTRLHVLLNFTDGVEEPGHAPSTRSCFIEYTGDWSDELTNPALTESELPLFKDATLEGFVVVDPDHFKQEIQRVQSHPTLHAIIGSNTDADTLVGTALTPTTIDEDELLRELLSCQMELMSEVESNFRMRTAIAANVFYHDFITFRTETARHHEKVHASYRYSVTWHTFRHSIARGMNDAVIPKHVLIAQANQAKKEARGRLMTEPAAVTPSRPSLTASASSASLAALQSPSSAEADVDEFVVCCVCFDNASPADNPILYCDRCNLTVHRVCYGLSTVPDHDWFCQYCEHQKSQIKAGRKKSMLKDANDSAASLSASSPTASVPTNAYPCALCPYRGGALKPTLDGRWCHILCAVLLQRSRLQSVEKMEPVVGVDEAIEAQRQHETCSVCGIDWGACIVCSHPQCSVSFHACCGWFQGYYFHAQVYDMHIKFSHFCPQHTPDYALNEVKVAQLNVSTPAASPAASPHIQSEANGRGHGRTDSDPLAMAPFTTTGVTIDSRLTVTDLSDDPNSWVPTSAAELLANTFSRQSLMVTPDLLMDMSKVNAASPMTFARQDSSISTMSMLDTAGSASPTSFATPDQKQMLINLRLFQQRDMRNRAREDRRPKDTKKKRRRVEKRRLERSRALHEDLYTPGRCAVCFNSDEQLEEQQRLWTDARQNTATNWIEVVTLAPPAAYPLNRLIKCDQCGVEVHQSCYGITDAALAVMQAKRAAVLAEKADETDESVEDSMVGGFVCQRCSANCRDLKCELCPRKGGAFKPVSEGYIGKGPGWIHAACAMWFPEVQIKELETLTDLEGVSTISKSKRRLRCCLCKRGGPCTPCSEPGCDQAFHPVCGLFAGVAMQLYTNTQHAAVKRRQFCPRHTSVFLARHIDIPHAFTMLTKLRKDFESARLILDSVRRREKVKQALIQCEFEIEQHKWQQATQACRDARLASVTASQSSDGMIKFKLSRAGSIPPASAAPSPRPWFRQGEDEEDLGIQLFAHQPNEVNEALSIEQSYSPSPLQFNPPKPLMLSVPPSPSTTALAHPHASPFQSILASPPLSAASTPICPERRQTRHQAALAATPRTDSLPLPQQMPLPLLLSPSLSPVSMSAATPARRKRNSIEAGIGEVKSDDAKRLRSAASAATSAAATPVHSTDKPGKRKGPHALASDEASDSLDANHNPINDMRSKRHRVSSMPITPKTRDTRANSPLLTASEAAPAPPVKVEKLTLKGVPAKKRGPKPKDKSLLAAAAAAAAAAAVAAAASAEPKSAMEPGSCVTASPVTAPRKRGRPRLSEVKARKDAAAAVAVPPSPAGTPATRVKSASAYFPNMESCVDHAQAPFPLHSAWMTQDTGGSYHPAVIYAIDHTLALAESTKQAMLTRPNGVTDDVLRNFQPVRGVQFNLYDFSSAKSRVDPEDEYCYFIHWKGWAARFDEWISGRLFKRDVPLVEVKTPSRGVVLRSQSPVSDESRSSHSSTPSQPADSANARRGRRKLNPPRQ